MKQAYTLGTLSLGLLLASGCSSELREDWTSEMRAALGSARAENDSHLEACLKADSLPEVLGELVRHEEQMRVTIQQMRRATDNMYRCSENSITTLSAEMFEMRASVPAHRWQLENASSLQGAHDECDAHASNVDATLQDMDTELNGMTCMGLPNWAPTKYSP